MGTPSASPQKDQAPTQAEQDEPAHVKADMHHAQSSPDFEQQRHEDPAANLYVSRQVNHSSQQSLADSTQSDCTVRQHPASTNGDVQEMLDDVHANGSPPGDTEAEELQQVGPNKPTQAEQEHKADASGMPFAQDHH